MITKREWIQDYLGNPDEWEVDSDGTIRDRVRDAHEQNVGHVTRDGDIAIISWSFSSTTTTTPNWCDDALA